MDKGLSRMEKNALSSQLMSEEQFNRLKEKVRRKEEPMAKKKKKAKAKKKKKKNKKKKK
jgi:hypothetical protein